MSNRWRVGVVEAPITAFLRPDFEVPARWLSPEPGPSCRRPCGHVDGAGLEVICEARHGQRGSPHLARLETGVVEPLLGFPSDAGLSHPCVLQEDSELYCVANVEGETSTHLYQRQASGEWAYAATLLEEFAALDAALFALEGRWWMSCARAAHPGQLWLFHAPTLRGPWRPHASSPFASPAAPAAGTPFLHEGVLYRPAVDRRGLVIQRVRRLTAAAFEEETAIRPRGQWRTLASVGAVTLVDAPAPSRLGRWRRRG